MDNWSLMRLTFDLAHKGEGWVVKKPMVGSIIVK